MKRAITDDSAGVTERRKRDHLEPFRTNGVNARLSTTWLEHVHLVHQALGELSLGEINLSARLCGRDFSAPIFITGMTGGTAEGRRINRELARLCQELGLGFGLGSVRAMLENEHLADTFQVRDCAPDVFLAANLGGVQLTRTPIERLRDMMKALGADALCVHLNPAQELLQAEGDRDFRGVVEAIRRAVRGLSWPIIVKETGCGISRETALRLRKIGVEWIDVSGVGGTSWAGVEILRSGRGEDAEAQALWDWGLPTAASVLELADLGMGIVASGGIRTGLDAARAISLGAHLVGLAAPVLQAWFAGGAEAARRLLRGIIESLRSVMLLCACADLDGLRRARKVLLGPLKQWRLELRGLGRGRNRGR